MAAFEPGLRLPQDWAALDALEEQERFLGSAFYYVLRKLSLPLDSHLRPHGRRSLQRTAA